MASKVKLRNKSQSIFCEVCAEQFTHDEDNVPRVLQCGHTFCECCIDKLIKRTSKLQFGSKSSASKKYVVCCPRCKNDTELSENDSSSLPKNYSSLDLIDDILEKQKKVCPHHPDYVLDMFCHDDEHEICLNCAIYGEHRTHSFCRLSGLCDHQKTSIKYQLDCAKSLIRDCNSLRHNLEARKEKLEEKIDEIKESIISTFTSIQNEVKQTLDAKLQSVLDDLKQWSDTQMSLLDENLKQLQVNELEDLKDKTQSFLDNADETEIAKETKLQNDIEASLEDIQNRKLYTQHKYEVKIDRWDIMVQTIKDIVHTWDCHVKEKEDSSAEVISSILEKHSPCIESSMSVLFGESEAVVCENLDRPFEGIGFTFERPDS